MRNEEIGFRSPRVDGVDSRSGRNEEKFVTINLTNAEIGMVLVALSSAENATRRDIRNGWRGKRDGVRYAGRLKAIRRSIQKQRREQRV
jgi:hypothetical protein